MILPKALPVISNSTRLVQPNLFLFDKYRILKNIKSVSFHAVE